MVNFLIAFLSVFFSGQQASVLFGFSGSMTKATNAANYIFWLDELQPTIRETPENRNVGPDTFSSLALEKLQFSYPLRPHARVLRGVDLHVKAQLWAAIAEKVDLPELEVEALAWKLGPWEIARRAAVSTPGL
ncbi:hypothetical protein FE257_005808 [Aspergillus nanangensis]|uniref:Uncharacterized protein n=1 Tax=Aspergillus nanangensis TaxID=2582783 RepID=A0AAD4GM25_ASPNN|nr:hypothetical protein FE257_005808 [Aspergillus nanangensis]